MCYIPSTMNALVRLSAPPLQLEKGRSSLSDGYYNITSLSVAREYIMHVHIKYIMTVRAYFVYTRVKVIYSR